MSPRVEPVLELGEGVTSLPLSARLSPAELNTFLRIWVEHNGAGPRQNSSNTR